jgi:CheY-like chemotaxis protein
VSRVILVCDDEPLIVELLKFYLEELGCEVVTATGPAEALEKIATNSRIEVLITDVKMPSLDGYELAERGRRLHRSLQVIIASGTERPKDLPFISKPVSRQRLAEVITGVTRRC